MLSARPVGAWKLKPWRRVVFKYKVGKWILTPWGELGVGRALGPSICGRSLHESPPQAPAQMQEIAIL
jgi:hypothetical protein